MRGSGKGWEKSVRDKGAGASGLEAVKANRKAAPTQMTIQFIEEKPGESQGLVRQNRRKVSKLQHRDICARKCVCSPERQAKSSTGRTGEIWVRKSMEV